MRVTQRGGGLIPTHERSPRLCLHPIRERCLWSTRMLSCMRGGVVSRPRLTPAVDEPAVSTMIGLDGAEERARRVRLSCKLRSNRAWRRIERSLRTRATSARQTQRQIAEAGADG